MIAALNTLFDPAAGPVLGDQGWEYVEAEFTDVHDWAKRVTKAVME